MLGSVHEKCFAKIFERFLNAESYTDIDLN